jgi:hypothetical protein
MAIRISLDLFTLIFRSTLAASFFILSGIICVACVDWASRHTWCVSKVSVLIFLWTNW